MINISRLASGALLIQKDGAELLIDQAAIPSALGPIILTLIDASRALGEARRQGYNDGLTVGHANGTREAEQRQRRDAEEIAEGLALIRVSAQLAA